MRRAALVVACLALAATTLVPGAAVAHDTELPSEVQEALPDVGGQTVEPLDHHGDVHSENMALVGRFDDDGAYRQGTDLAFWRTTAVLGNYDNPGGFRLLDISNPTAPREIGQFACGGSRQGDVSIWRDLVFVSVDDPKVSPECGSATSRVDTGSTWEGIRIVSITDPANPRQIATVDTDCGSHTHTLVPDKANDRLLIYVLSYPLTAQGVNCSFATHRKISVIEVPAFSASDLLSKMAKTPPEEPRVLSTPSVAPAIGCHDVTVLVPRRLAAAACITESQLWNITDPANPRVVSHIVNPEIQIHHSTTFSNDGMTMVIGDELGGAAVTPGCADGNEHLPLGALWFYDVSDAGNPQLLRSWRIPQVEASLFCTAHNFNVVPMETDRDVLVSAWYNGGTTVLDFTAVRGPDRRIDQIGFYIPKEPRIAAPWSSYWYRGFIYANNFDEDVNSLSPHSRGLDVFAIADRDLKLNQISLPHLNPQTMERLPSG